MIDSVNTPAATAAQLPAAMLDATARDAGYGVSDQPDDQLIPIIYVLHQQSPACDTRGANYIAGAEPGRFLRRSAIEPVSDDLTVIPCHMVRAWLEWPPGRTGNLIGRHTTPTSKSAAGILSGPATATSSSIQENFTCSWTARLSCCRATGPGTLSPGNGKRISTSSSTRIRAICCRVLRASTGCFGSSLLRLSVELGPEQRRGHDVFIGRSSCFYRTFFDAAAVASLSASAECLHRKGSDHR
jgi:hypothetical protein